MASSNQNRLSRDDWKKAKELEELRKTGAAPPELDEDGKMINPHIPLYISKVPWYVSDGTGRATLKHQKPNAFGRVDPTLKPSGIITSKSRIVSVSLM